MYSAFGFSALPTAPKAPCFLPGRNAPAPVCSVRSRSQLGLRSSQPVRGSGCKRMELCASVAGETDVDSAASATENDIYSKFWAHADSVMKSRLPDLSAYPIPDGFKTKEEVTGKGKRAQWVKTTSYAYQTQKLRQVRAAHVQGGRALQVLNYVIFPHMNYDVPFFGADLVTLPGGHLIALDMQPLLHTEEYKEKYSGPLMETFEKYKEKLEWGGDFPEEAAQYFSPCFLWTRPSETETVDTVVFDAFKDYLNIYLDIIEDAPKITDEEYLSTIRERQISYLKYRAEKDPARGMFQRFYGPDWTEEYIHGFLFDLEEKLEKGEYKIPV
eukprot:CAMPEP_0185843746 /NCGR_PEP_ID=MMETSP1354-20130828/153_1 /TAXON_ID=708628 /ORGANISM="Erythrolobus madagascarensis, Strain CCMP3276" /LENGTH=327 /DNA_ID=CAMNT_0028543289 /DNA_START=84 /DNA_END=1067 /DNA_ORIENTATION=+